MPAAMPCKTPESSGGETHCGIGGNETKHACIVETDESTRYDWKEFLKGIMKIILQRKEYIH